MEYPNDVIAPGNVFICPSNRWTLAYPSQPSVEDHRDIGEVLMMATYVMSATQSWLGPTTRIQLSEVAEENDSARILTLPWTRRSPYRKRKIVQGANDAKTYARPMPADARAILIEAFRDAHRWLDALVAPHVPSLWKSEGDGGV